MLRRCTKITKLDVARTGITEKSVIGIAKQLEKTLETLDVSYTQIKFPDITLLGSMPRIKVLNCRGSSIFTIDHLKKSFPNLNINEEYCHFANSDEIFHPNAGLWDIDTKQYVFKGALKQAIKNSARNLQTH